MCDYSLQGLPNRLAVEEEELVTHRFLTGSIGLASPKDITAASKPKPSAGRCSFWAALKCWLTPQFDLAAIPAVCVPPGTRLLMTHIPETTRWNFTLNVAEEVTFIQLSAEAFQFRDAIRFANGRHVLLQSLREGVRFEVLSLDSSEPAVESEFRESPSLARPAA